jgi:hypothetical protein
MRIQIPVTVGGVEVGNISGSCKHGYEPYVRQGIREWVSLYLLRTVVLAMVQLAI